MRKRLLFLLVLLVTLSGCGKKEIQDNKVTTGQVENENVIVCTSNQSSTQYELNSTYTIYHDGRYVDYVHSVTYLFSSNSKLLDSMYESEREAYKKMDEKYGGYDYDVSRMNNKVVSDAKINYSDMNIQKLISDDPSLSKYVRNGKMLVDGIKDFYMTKGATCE